MAIQAERQTSLVSVVELDAIGELGSHTIAEVQHDRLLQSHRATNVVRRMRQPIPTEIEVTAGLAATERRSGLREVQRGPNGELLRRAADGLNLVDMKSKPAALKAACLVDGSLEQALESVIGPLA